MSGLMRRNAFGICLILTVFGLPMMIGSMAYAQSENPKALKRQLITQPIALSEQFSGEQGFIVVPENRSKANSREITVHYFRFKSKSDSKRPPVFVLPGGPGEPYTEERLEGSLPEDQRFGLMTEIAEYLKDRDVVLVNQRGNQRAPGLLSRGFVMFAEPAKMDAPFDFAAASERLTAGAKKSLEKWEAMGMDLSGYDILNLVDDINDLRESLGYRKICLRGSSFGSQSSLAFIRRYPANVDRAIIHGVEPVSYGYDDPTGIWEVYRRLDKMASEQEDLDLEEGELLTAIQTLIQRLEKEPVTVASRHPKRDVRMKVTLGANDLRMNLDDTRTGRTRRESLEYWPAYIKDMLDGDFRYLASAVIDDRPEYYQGIVMSHLMDNSLGITGQREQLLDESPAVRWLGDINWRYKATRKVTPTKRVDDSFLEFKETDVPVLMIQGNLDLSTPLENATDQLEYLKNGHLITIDGGTHGTVRDAQRTDPGFPNHLYRFMAADFEKTTPQELYKQFPDEVELPKLNFKKPELPLFELLIERPGSGKK